MNLPASAPPCRRTEGLPLGLLLRRQLRGGLGWDGDGVRREGFILPPRSANVEQVSLTYPLPTPTPSFGETF